MWSFPRGYFRQLVQDFVHQRHLDLPRTLEVLSDWLSIDDLRESFRVCRHKKRHTCHVSVDTCMCVIISYVCINIYIYTYTCVCADMMNVEWLTHLCWPWCTGTNEDFCTTLGACRDVHDFKDWDYLRSAKTDRNRDTWYHTCKQYVHISPVESSCQPYQNLNGVFVLTHICRMYF